ISPRMSVDIMPLNAIYGNNIMCCDSEKARGEGKSYQGVKDALRRDAAIHLLLNPGLTLEDVAQQVGFSETSTFHRAFKKWTGVTPGLYRQLHGYH
ncbi:MAG: helix-turn-helix domain-containing protein, partial [Acinetobacter johnsonii]